MALKLSCVSQVCRNVFPNLLKKRNLTAILLILIPEYGQSNVTLLLCQNMYILCSALRLTVI